MKNLDQLTFQDIETFVTETTKEYLKRNYPTTDCGLAWEVVTHVLDELYDLTKEKK